MVNTNLFRWLVNYHCSHNLEACRPYIHNGIIYSPSTSEPLREGFEENELQVGQIKYKGVLIVSNGRTLLDDLIAGDVIEEGNIGPFVGIDGENSLFDYLDNQENSDGGHILDSANNQIARAYEFNNKPPALGINGTYSLFDRIPHDFCSYDGKVSPINNLGLKTRLAIKLPQVKLPQVHPQQAHPHIETYQIKRTAYTPLGMGKVTHFNKDGLAEEFFLMQNPDSENEEIIGVHRNYSRENGELSLAKERIAPIDSYLDALKEPPILKESPGQLDYHHLPVLSYS